MTSIKCYVFPSESISENTLTDGDNGKVINIETPSWLAWFDLNPRLRFDHPTAYLLITDSINRMVEGTGWPVLDGERILYGDAPSRVNCYFHSNNLVPGDRLSDGDGGEEFEIIGPTRLIWIDLAPGYRFAHPTAYVFVSAAGIQIRSGKWWPVLNDQRILYGTSELLPIELPLTVNIPAPDGRQ